MSVQEYKTQFEACKESCIFIDSVGSIFDRRYSWLNMVQVLSEEERIKKFNQMVEEILKEVEENGI